jgi:hypothetical protein
MWAKFLGNVGSSTSQNAMGLRSLLQGYTAIYITSTRATGKGINLLVGISTGRKHRKHKEKHGNFN